ncbi:MAG: sulfotransferase family 2 domain-containing protein [Sulfitobacter sp.]
MPIAKISGKLVYFAHVPKCAGTAVEDYLANAFGPLAFLDRCFNAQPSQARWTRSSPQHVEVEGLSALFPSDFFDATFAVVRNPVSRLTSTFRFQRDVEGTIDINTTFSDWLRTVKHKQRTSPWQFDNHTRRMTDIVPDSAKVFRLEDGLGAVVKWLQVLAGPEHSLPIKIAPQNALDKRLLFEGKPLRPVNLTKGDIGLIERQYAVDFERFGYDRLRRTKAEMSAVQAYEG